MNKESAPISSQFSILRAAEAVTNWRAMVMTGMAILAAMFCLMLTLELAKHSSGLAVIFCIVTFFVCLIGYSSIGIVLMRKSQGHDIEFTQAIMQATFSVHRLLGVGVLLFLIFIGIGLICALILAACRLPGIGSLLYGLALPVLSVVVGVTIVGVMYVGFPLTAPSVWVGNTIYESVARLILIIRKRLLNTITSLVVLSLLVFFLSSIVFFILTMGYTTTSGIASMVGIEVGGGAFSFLSQIMGTPSSLLLGLGRNYGNVEYVAPSLWGAGILFAIAMIIPFLTFVNGICLIYLQVSQGLDVQETEQKLKAHVQQIKSRVNEAKEQANTKLQEAKESMRKAAIPEAAATEMPDHTQPQHRHCSHCQTRLSKDDIFCGECGTKNPIA